MAEKNHGRNSDLLKICFTFYSFLTLVQPVCPDPTKYIASLKSSVLL